MLLYYCMGELFYFLLKEIYVNGRIAITSTNYNQYARIVHLILLTEENILNYLMSQNKANSLLFCE